MPPRPLPVALALALAPLLARSLAARPLPFSNLQAGPSPTVEMPPDERLMPLTFVPAKTGLVAMY